MGWGEAAGPTPSEARTNRLHRAVAQLVTALDEYDRNPTTGNAEVVRVWRETVRTELPSRVFPPDPVKSGLPSV